MGSDHLPPVEQSAELAGVRVLRSTGHRPRGLARVLGLNGDQVPDHRVRGRGVRPHKMLASQPPPSDVAVLHHHPSVADATGSGKASGRA